MGALETAVGPLQPPAVAGDQRRDEGLGGGVDQGLAGAEQKAGEHQQRDAGPAEQHRDGERPDDGEAAGVHHPHHPPPIPAVQQRPGD
jgi:hypothetical protein